MEKTKKRIVIVGGGISGLSLLHYLKIKHSSNKEVEIQLLEKKAHWGGTIRSVKQGEYLFEAGPNGFLDSKPRTLQLIKEINAEHSLLRANEEAKIRYISVNNTLHALPSDPKSFLQFKLLSIFDKLRICAEPFIPKGKDPKESVYAFGRRRLGRRFPELFLDAMVKGIYGGNVRKINLKAAFPRIYTLEQEYGSLFKALGKLRKEKKKKDSQLGTPTGQLTSFNNGMQEIIEILGSSYSKHIQLSHTIDSLSYQDNNFLLHGTNGQVRADELYLATPAYQASKLLENINPKLASLLKAIEYAPIAVVGFVFDKKKIKNFPKGFGFLIPSSESKKVMGILFDSNIYPDRCSKDEILLRVMIGGSEYPQILEVGKESLHELALSELKNYVDIEGVPKDKFFISWSKAIPQYTNDYLSIKEGIMTTLAEQRNLHLNANYLGGISFNDCIENAYLSAQSSSKE